MNKSKPIILVIDDEENIRDGCSTVLRGDGYRVELAENGPKGIDLAKMLVPDIILLDIKMPKIDGLEVLQHITKECPTSVVIIITGFASVEYAVQSMKYGASDFLSKPFLPEDLILMVRRGLEKKKLLEEMENLKIEKRRMTDYFTSIVSHQLRTPIAVASQYFVVLLNNLAGEIPEEARKIIQRANFRLVELMELIEDWLSLTKFDPEKIRNSSEMTEVVTIIKNQIDFFSPLINEKNIVIKTEYPDTPVLVRLDEKSLKEILSNLLSNAIKYNKFSGDINISLRAEESRCSIRIKDSGIGIAKEHLDFLFNEFYRVKDETTRDIMGTGLGLAIVKKIIESVGGSIIVRSKIGVGSTFTVALPLKELN